MDAHNKHLYINDQSWVSYLKIGASKGLLNKKQTNKLKNETQGLKKKLYHLKNETQRLIVLKNVHWGSKGLIGAHFKIISPLYWCPKKKIIRFFILFYLNYWFCCNTSVKII